ncbi:MAG: hypothetical protein LBU16_01855 [Treponema sp.]|jgi:hypothetical protein|nr:hypothetical protein [Treponema sp.]
MDQRKNSIRELEEKKRETLENLNKLLETWGETLLSRLDREDPDRFAGELGRYRHFRETIAVFKGRIQTLEHDTLRLRDLEKELAEKGAGAAEKTGALKELYIRLGEIALQHDAAFDSEASLKAQADALTARINAWQEKLGELEEGKTAGILSWIGGSAQGIVIRSRLTKNQAGLNRIYRSAGEQFFAVLERQDGGDIPAGDIPTQIRALRQELALLEESCAALRDEGGTLRESLGIGGNSRYFNPAKKIRDLEQRIAREQEQLLGHCAAFGNQLCCLHADSEADEGAWLQTEDKTVLEKAREMQGRIAGHEAAITELKASLQIDEERNAIDKMKKSMLSHRQRIAASESAIAGLEKQIEESNRHIGELMKITNQEFNRKEGE